ncbi:SIS domain-containing protein [Marinimicrobium agarilyticum]|uniref:SIS domain-containing protein n=1 Tax=Marinimicrobium agarilyticum TaxID=306546 RepID=UPI000418824C|nr:SIS domain-containing protein [Marinimicrobium agarilyticum]
MEQRVITLFHESIEATMQTGEALAPQIVQASEVMVEALLNGHKILTCGNGISAAQAQILTSCLLHRFEQERPSLPALNLGSDMTTQTAIASEGGGNDIYSKPLRAIGQEGDVLVLVTSSGNAGSLLQAISAAHDRDIRVIALTGGDGGDAASLLDHRDIELRATLSAPVRIHEVHLLTIFCLCDLIDQHLFGGFH